MDIIIDTQGEADLTTRDCLISSDEDDIELENNGINLPKIFDLPEYPSEDEESTKKVRRNVTKDIDLNEFEMEMGWSHPQKKQPTAVESVSSLTKTLTDVEKVLKKSVIKPGFEQLHAVPPYDESMKKIRARRQQERKQTKGKKWFNMRPPEMTPEIKHDLEVIQMRSVLDPKHFYKKNDLKVLPKYFHIGKVIDSPKDYYSDRLTKKERKSTIVDELMANAEFAKYNKRKYKEIIDEKKKLHYKAHRHAKRLKGRKN